MRLIKFTILCIGALSVSTFMTTTTYASNGQGTYNAICSACHATGVANAPKFGDQKAWAARIAEGQSVLTAHAYVGLGAMPPKGGRPDLSLEDFAAAVALMATEAGAKWKNPDAKQIKEIRMEIAKREKELKLKQKIK